MTNRNLRHTIYSGTFIDTPNPTELRVRTATSVGVDSLGTIVFICLSTEESAAAEKHGFQSSTTRYIRIPKDSHNFFFPGLIDTHTHAPQYPNAGLFGSSTLLSWLETYTFPMESSMANIELARRVYSTFVARTISHGTTCAAYYGTIHVPATNLLADICHNAGQRALVGRVCMDRMSPDHYRDESPAQAVEATEACLAHCRKIDPSGEIVRGVITPRFAPSCTWESLAGLGQLYERCRGDDSQQPDKATPTQLPSPPPVLIQTHIAENPAENALVRRLFPTHKSYTHVYDSAGLLSPDTILAHAIHLSDEEVALIRARGTVVSHCPVSNTSLASGTAAVRRLWDAGITVGLGTDVSGGYAPSVLEAARNAVMVSRHLVIAGRSPADIAAGSTEGASDEDRLKLSVPEALYLATVGGARSVGLSRHVGLFDEGMSFDALLVSLDRVPAAGLLYTTAGNATFDAVPTAAAPTPLDAAHTSERGPVDIFGWESWPDIAEKWTYYGDDRNVGAVWVRGRCIHWVGPRMSGIEVGDGTAS